MTKQELLDRLTHINTSPAAYRHNLTAALIEDIEAGGVQLPADAVQSPDAPLDPVRWQAAMIAFDGVGRDNRKTTYHGLSAGIRAYVKGTPLKELTMRNAGQHEGMEVWIAANEDEPGANRFYIKGSKFSIYRLTSDGFSVWETTVISDSAENAVKTWCVGRQVDPQSITAKEVLK